MMETDGRTQKRTEADVKNKLSAKMADALTNRTTGNVRNVKYNTHGINGQIL